MLDVYDPVVIRVAFGPFQSASDGESTPAEYGATPGWPTLTYKGPLAAATVNGSLVSQRARPGTGALDRIPSTGAAPPGTSAAGGSSWW